MMRADDAIGELIRTRPPFHGPGETWGLASDVMWWLAEQVGDSSTTIETGCGHSSALFAIKGSDHTIVAPSEREHSAVRSWCQERGFSTERVTSVIELSQVALPSLDHGPFDLALIDGGHAFPIPALDWFYLAQRLKVGGCVVVDDTGLRPCGLLRDFLATERDRWELDEQIGRAAVFRKTSTVVIPQDDWAGQPWSRQRPSGRLRAAVRLRGRIQALRAGASGGGWRRG